MDLKEFLCHFFEAFRQGHKLCGQGSTEWKHPVQAAVSEHQGEGIQPVDNTDVFIIDSVQLLFKPEQVALDDGNCQAFLGGEVMVNTRLFNADVVRKVGIAEGRIAFRAQQNLGAGQKV